MTKIPAAISGLVIAVAILLTFAGPPFSLHGTLLILMLAYLVVFMPQASIAAEVARGQVGDDLLEAAAMSGISRFRTTIGILLAVDASRASRYGWALVFVLVVGRSRGGCDPCRPREPFVGTAFAGDLRVRRLFGSRRARDIVAVHRRSIVVGVVTTVYGRPVRRKDRMLSAGRGRNVDESGAGLTGLPSKVR